MYRTVHRTKPRKLVLRAIRWVNPKRMFPGAGLSKEEMENMSKEALSELIVQLNDYRGEAHVIHNRYNQMIDMINAGELPYYIPYAGFDQNKWGTLQDYMDRAERLKDGTEALEKVLDKQALEIRSILRKKHDTRLDDIEGLWVDANGEAAAPNFFDLKQKAADKKLLRTQRITADGSKITAEPRIFARRYISVPAAEVRAGEEVRMPAGGELRRPPKGTRARRYFDRYGGGSTHLARVPRGFGGLSSKSQKELQAKGQLISFPAGRKGGTPLIITYDEVSNDAVAIRRANLWRHR